MADMASKKGVHATQKAVDKEPLKVVTCHALVIVPSSFIYLSDSDSDSDSEPKAENIVHSVSVDSFGADFHLQWPNLTELEPPLPVCVDVYVDPDLQDTSDSESCVTNA